MVRNELTRKIFASNASGVSPGRLLSPKSVAARRFIMSAIYFDTKIHRQPDPRGNLTLSGNSSHMQIPPI